MNMEPRAINLDKPETEKEKVNEAQITTATTSTATTSTATTSAATTSTATTSTATTSAATTSTAATTEATATTSTAATTEATATTSTTEATSTTSPKKEVPYSPLEKHIKYQGGGINISTTSIYNKNRALGDGVFEAATNAATVSAIAGTQIKGCPFRMFHSDEAVGVLNHSHHTGIYRPDGYIDEEVWNELCGYSVKNDKDEAIIKKSDFYRFLQVRRNKEKATDLFGEKASNGEWEKYWHIFGSKMKDDKYVMLADLRTYFEDSEKIGLQVEARVRNGM